MPYRNKFLVINVVMSFLFVFLLVNNVEAQRPGSGFAPEKQKKNKPFVPDNPEREQKKSEDNVDKLSKKGKVEPGDAAGEEKTRGWWRRFFKTKNKEYDAHHDRIQTKAVRKRMKKNEKKSRKVNNHKKPSVFKRMFKKRRR